MNNHINLSPYCFIIRGYNKGILLDGYSNSIYHMDKYLTSFLYNACYYDDVDYKILKDKKISYNLKLLLEKKIISISNYKLRNIPITSFRNSNFIIRSLNVELINICNQRCFHCYFYQNKSRIVKKRIFDFKIYKKIIKDLIRYGLSVINLVGGEPTLLGIKKLEKYIKYAYSQKHIYLICLNTNCTQLDDYTISLLSKYRDKLIISITIHSADKKLNDQISGYEGDFKNKLKVIQKLKEKNIRYSVFTVVSKYNFKSYAETLKLLNLLKPDYQNLPVVHFARISDPKIKLHKNNLIFKKIDFLNPFRNLKKINLNMYDVLIKVNKHSCFYDKLYIDVNYNFYFCNESHSEQTYIGNYKKINYNIFNLLNSNLYKQRINKNLNIKCSICEFKYLCIHCYNFQKYLKYYFMNDICNYDPISSKIKQYNFLK